ncbi:MAG: SBBP repeat-containing protein, partial [Bacteroidetes bacterium]|nr:SBBP repeat-containing protein [Bacteroidota bacterium]
MKRAILGLFLVCLIQLFFNFSHAEAIIKTKAVKQISEKSPTFRLNETYGKLPLYFVRNDGQLDKKVKFYEKGRGHAVYFTKEGVFLSLMVTGKPRKSRWQHALIKLIPLNANKELMIVAEGHKKTKVNFFIGNDPKKWKTNIPTYGAIIYKDVYKNTDIRFYGNNRELEYDVIMRPGADLNDIKFSYEGIEALSITKDGDLNIILKEGMLIQKRPRIYQKIDGKEVQVTGKFKIQSKKSNIIGKESTTNSQRFVYGFEVASYHTRYPLIIDPTLSYSTYLGGSSDDDGYGIAVDSNGNAYIAGYTKSTDFPTASAIYGNNSGSWDAFIAKINSNGSALVYSTYLGGSNNETVDMGIAVDSDGNAYVTGYTNSTDFPTASAIYGELSGITDAFVTKINVDGSSLVYSTYLGGSRNEDGKGIAVDGNSNAYVTGRTNSTDFPTASAIYGNFAGGVTDAFVTKINADGSALVYSTYLGGSNDDGTEMGIAVDSDGNAYVTGNTNSNDFPIVSAIYEELAGGQDSFVTKINSDGSTLVYSTYLGGSGTDGGKGIAVDNDGNAYVAGNTSSNDFPIASAIYEEPAGGSDAFVTKINSNGSAFVYSTYLGGSGTDGGKGIA